MVTTGVLRDVIVDVQVFDFRASASGYLQIVFKLDLFRKFSALSYLLRESIQNSLMAAASNGTLNMHDVTGVEVSVDQHDIASSSLEGRLEMALN